MVFRSFLLFLLTACPSVMPSLAFPQSLLSSTQDRYSVAGMVINSVTGEPIRNALVQIYVNGQSSMLTGPDGKFQFDGLPAAQFSNINVRKPGFFPEDDLQSVRFYQAVTIGPNTLPIVVKLVPEGVIYGRISEEDGEPLEGLPIALFVQVLQNGRKVWQQRPGAQTDDDGSFRIAELQPGNYFLSAGPSRDPVAFSAKLSQSRAQGIPLVYYPGSSDLSAAAPISVTPGKKVEADFKISPQPFYRISGTISGYASGQTVNLQLRSAIGIPFPYASLIDSKSGTFRIPGVPAGSYAMQASVPDSRGNGLTATIPLTVGADLTGVRLVLLPTVIIPIETQIISSRPGGERFWEQKNFSPVSVHLISHNSGFFEPTYSSQQTGEGGAASLEVHGIAPGTYHVEIYPNGPFYVQAAVSGITNLLDSDLSVAPGSAPQPIEIILRDDVAHLSGTVSEDNKPLRATILAISEHPSVPPRIQPTDATGGFQFPLLPPGAYKVLALDHPDRLEYTNPDAMRNYLSKAREITLSPDQFAKIDLELVKVGD